MTTALAWEWLNDELIVLDTRSGKYYQLNETAGTMLIELSRGQTVDQVAEQIAKDFEVTPEAARQDVEKIRSDFSSIGLLD